MNSRLLIAAFFVALNVFNVTGANRTRLDKGWRSSIGIESEWMSPGYDDTGWLSVAVPHDWSITYAPDSAANAGNDGGYLPGVKSTYRNVVYLPQLEEGLYYLYLEGAYMEPTVWINGDEVESHTYGYTSWRCNITDWLVPGDNTIVITVDNSRQKNSRWYSGSGLLRPVWLEHYAPYSVDAGSMHVSTPGIRPGMAIGRLEAIVRDNHQDRLGDATVAATLVVTDPDGVALQPENVMVTFDNNRSEVPVLVDFPIPDPQLWSPDSPKLYTATLTIDNGDGMSDSETVTFGLRSFDYDAEEGAFLNDEPIKINGACLHHDNGMLGGAAYAAAEWRKASLIKQAGFNAVRTSHNPPSTAFLEACDQLGLLVIDEAFDGWAESKTPHDYGEVFKTDWPEDLEAMVLRDRNHPSVIAWSIGNEILERKSPQAVEWAHEMAALCHRLDPNRPVTQALASWDDDWEIYDPLAAAHDIIGYNYMIHKVEGDHERVPDRVVWQTESYPRDAWSNYLKVRDLPYVIGDFVWTGMDYLGESGIGRHYYAGEVPGEHWERNLWPWHASQCGDLDITGHRKPISYYRDMLYNGKDTVYMAVREPQGYRGEIKETLWGIYPTYESWTWPGHEGKPIEVEAISRYPRVDLLLDGEKVGSGEPGESNGYKVIFNIPYRPGKLEAVGYDSAGKEVEKVALSTAGEVADIVLDFNRFNAPGTDYDLVWIDATLVDAAGILVPESDEIITFNVGEGVELLATGSADPKDRVAASSPARRTCRGRAQAIVRLPHGAPVPVSSSRLVL